MLFPVRFRLPRRGAAFLSLPFDETMPFSFALQTFKVASSRRPFARCGCSSKLEASRAGTNPPPKKCDSVLAGGRSRHPSSERHANRDSCDSQNASGIGALQEQLYLARASTVVERTCHQETRCTVDETTRAPDAERKHRVPPEDATPLQVKKHTKQKGACGIPDHASQILLMPCPYLKGGGALETALTDAMELAGTSNSGSVAAVVVAFTLRMTSECDDEEATVKAWQEKFRRGTRNAAVR